MCGQRWAKYIDPVTGRRSDAAHRYVHAALDEGFENLHVLCNTTVSRVLLAEDGTATGVEIIPTCATPDGFSTATPPAPTTVLARKLVVVSAGALGTPMILERSGIGAPSVLRAAGVTPQIDLPGVGEDYQDHNLLLPVFEMRPDILTHDLIFRGDTAALSSAEASFAQGRGHLASNSIDFAGKVRPTDKQLAEMPASFQEHYNRIFATNPDKPLAVIVPVNALLAGHENFPPDTRYVTVAVFSGYPVSRGHVHIGSTSPYAHPFLDPGFLKDDRDVPPLVWAYKVLREMMRRTRCCIGAISSPNPGERYERGGEGWTPEGMPEAAYTEEENKNIEMWVRRNSVTTWHSLGTCAMKPREDGGVVDPKLRVYGTERLILADLSIAPGNVGMYCPDGRRNKAKADR
jgi:alcohol oxidase